MNKGKTIFSQIMSLIPERDFKACVDRYKGNYRSRNFSCKDQFLVKKGSGDRFLIRSILKILILRVGLEFIRWAVGIPVFVFKGRFTYHSRLQSFLIFCTCYPLHDGIWYACKAGQCARSNSFFMGFPKILLPFLVQYIQASCSICILEGRWPDEVWVGFDGYTEAVWGNNPSLQLAGSWIAPERDVLFVHTWNDVQIRLAPELLEYARYLESADSLQCTQKSVVCLPLSI